MTTTEPPLSVCIVTYERPDFLRRCLEALVASIADDVQIVVVDASRVSAREAVAAIGPSIRYIHDRSVAGWMTRARNVALLAARGRVVSFLDDDVVIRPGWDRALLAAFEDPSVAAVAGRTCNGLPGEEQYDLPIGRLREDGSLTEGFATDGDARVEVDHGIGANMSFRRDVMAELGGFRDDYPGTALREDTDMFLRVRALGGRVVFDPAAAVDHLPAPHVHGARFDTRYKLYARRNHMVLLARAGGIRSPRLRRWIAGQYRGVADAAGAAGKAKRLAVTTVGIGWGAAAMLRDAGWGPLPPARRGGAAERIRTSLRDETLTDAAPPGALRIHAYVMLADPSFLRESLAAYYPHVSKIVLSFDENARSWTGTPLPIAQCRELVREVDVDGKCVEVPGDFSHLDQDPLDNDTAQRQHALDAASEGADWVLQLDTDEVMLDPEAFFTALARADARGAAGLDFPARWLYTRPSPGRYLESSTRFWRIAGGFPGPLAVRAGSRLKLARQSEGPLYRVDFRARNTDRYHPKDAPIDEVVGPESGVAHFSRVRDPEGMKRKSGWSGHTVEMSPPPIYRAWAWRTRHPWLTAATTPLRRKGWYRLASIPEPPGGEPPVVTFTAEELPAVS
ncbi:glycosyltransferase [Microbacter sp. GSS18]|nr:glycosyltransferase [Microbacter sp. GSS18]